MIRKIKNKVRRFEDDSAGMQRLVEDQMALTQLLKMFDNGVFIPLTGWSISPREVLHACNDIVISDRRFAVEFGSGFSTICIARLLQITKKPVKFISVESNAEWAREFTRILESMGLLDFVTIVPAPLVELPQAYAKDGGTWYDTKRIADALPKDGKVDLVIVDGPHGATCRMARFPAVPFLMDRLADNFAVFLDDASRPEEQQIAAEWKQLLGSERRDYNRYVILSKGGSGFDTSPFGFTRLCSR